MAPGREEVRQQRLGPERGDEWIPDLETSASSTTASAPDGPPPAPPGSTRAAAKHSDLARHRPRLRRRCGSSAALRPPARRARGPGSRGTRRASTACGVVGVERTCSRASSGCASCSRKRARRTRALNVWCTLCLPRPSPRRAAGAVRCLANRRRPRRRTQVQCACGRANSRSKASTSARNACHVAHRDTSPCARARRSSSVKPVRTSGSSTLAAGASARRSLEARGSRPDPARASSAVAAGTDEWRSLARPTSAETTPSGFGRSSKILASARPKSASASSRSSSACLASVAKASSRPGRRRREKLQLPTIALARERKGRRPAACAAPSGRGRSPARTRRRGARPRRRSARRRAPRTTGAPRRLAKCESVPRRPAAQRLVRRLEDRLDEVDQVEAQTSSSARSQLSTAMQSATESLPSSRREGPRAACAGGTRAGADAAPARRRSRRSRGLPRRGRARSGCAEVRVEGLSRQCAGAGRAPPAARGAGVAPHDRAPRPGTGATRPGLRPVGAERERRRPARAPPAIPGPVRGTARGAVAAPPDQLDRFRARPSRACRGRSPARRRTLSWRVRPARPRRDDTRNRAWSARAGPRPSPRSRANRTPRGSRRARSSGRGGLDLTASACATSRAARCGLLRALRYSSMNDSLPPSARADRRGRGRRRPRRGAPASGESQIALDRVFAHWRASVVLP